MEAGVFYEDTHSTKLSGESDTFTDKEHPPPTQAGEKKSAFKKSPVPFSLTPALSCPSVFPILILEHLHSYFSFALGLVFIVALPHLPLLFNKILSSVYPVARHLPKSLRASSHWHTQTLCTYKQSSGSFHWAPFQSRPGPQVPWLRLQKLPAASENRNPGEGTGLESVK